MNILPIGIYDSGLGGLTVVKQIVKLLPQEDIVYLGDNARVPYGTRSPETIIRFSEEDVKFLLTQKVKCIVIACHTSSAIAGKQLEKEYKKIPIFDVVTPVIEKLIGLNARIGVIGTRATIASGVYSKIKGVVQMACPLFVPFIEEGENQGKLMDDVIEKYLAKFKVDILVLACTHYPIIADKIKKVVDNNVRLIDPGVLVAANLKAYLTKNKMLNPKKSTGIKKYFVTDLNERFKSVAEMFLGHRIEGKLYKATL